MHRISPNRNNGRKKTKFVKLEEQKETDRETTWRRYTHCPATVTAAEGKIGE